MVVSHTRGRKPTKRIDMYKDHEFVVGRLVVGEDESMEAPSVLMGGGTWTYPIECAVADHHFLNFITRGMASSGSSKFMAVDHYLGVSGGSPTIYRGCMELEDGIYAANASAADFTLRFGTSGSKVVGEGHALAAQLRVPNRSMDTGGLMSAAKFEVYLDGTSANWNTSHGDNSIIRIQCQGGNTAARRKVVSAILFTGETGNKANKYLVCNADVNGGGASGGGIQINVNGTPMWLATYAIA